MSVKSEPSASAPLYLADGPPRKPEPANQQQGSHQGLPPLSSKILHPQPAGSIVQQSPESARPGRAGSFASPHSTQHGLPTPQGSYLQSSAGHQQQENLGYYNPHPSPYSTASTSGSYPASDQSDLMATAHMRPHPPPMYPTPQSNSPASIHSPQDVHGRPMYAQPGQQSVFYPQYPLSSHQGYYGSASHPQHQSIGSQPSLRTPYQSSHMMQPPTTQQPQTPVMDPNQRSPYDQMQGQRPIPPMGPPQLVSDRSGSSMYSAQPGGNNANASAAPGPIPATTPLVIEQDQKGVTRITFEYSRDRVKMPYRIRCDIDTVDTDKLPQDFKDQNCVYPRACNSKEPYKGNRFEYESQCNSIGWSLAHLNPEIQGKRGLIQRAVDSWRNSHEDTKYRSRRVRRMAKNNRRQANQQSPLTQSSSAPAIVNPSQQNVPQAQRMSSGHVDTSQGQQPQYMFDRTPQSATSDNSSLRHHSQQLPDLHKSPSAPPADPRYVQNFYPSFPVNQQAVAGMTEPPMRTGLEHPNPHQSQHSTMVATSLPGSNHGDKDNARDFHDPTAGLFSDLLTNSTTGKLSVTIKDRERDKNPRLTFKLDGLNMREVEPYWRKNTSVYPRSYQEAESEAAYRHEGDNRPSQARVGQAASVGERHPDREEEDVEVMTRVPVRLPDGFETTVSAPPIGRERLDKERILNDMASRISYDKMQMFNGRNMFLQRALDDLRSELRKRYSKINRPLPHHLETGVGKRKWKEGPMFKSRQHSASVSDTRGSTSK